MSTLVDSLEIQHKVPAWQRYQDGDNNAASDFLKEVNPTIENAIHRYAGDDQSYKTQARILALNAAKTFNPKAGANINTHVFNHLQRLQRISAQRGNLTHLSEGASTQRAAIARAKRDYEIDHGEEPTVEELASFTGISRKRIDDLAKYRPIVPDSITVSPEGDSLVASNSTKALDIYDKYIYNELDRIDKKIYEWSTGYGGMPIISKVEMAKKLNISPAAVTKRAIKIDARFNQDREMIKRSLGIGQGYED